MKLQKCSADDDTSPDIPSTSSREDNDSILGIRNQDLYDPKLLAAPEQQTFISHVWPLRDGCIIKARLGSAQFNRATSLPRARRRGLGVSGCLILTTAS